MNEFKPGDVVAHHRRKSMNTKQIILALIAVPLLVACGVTGGNTPTAPTPTVTVTAEPEPEPESTHDDAELNRLAARMVWNDQTAEDQKNICGLFNLDPAATIHILGEDVDDEGLMDAVETLLEEEC